MMCRSEGVSDDADAPVSVGLGAWVWVGAGVVCVVGLGTGVGVGRLDAVVTVRCRVLMGVEDAIGVTTRVGDSVDLVSIAAGVVVRVGLAVRMGAAGRVILGLRLPQAYDDSEQHEQIMQAIKKMVA